MSVYYKGDNVYCKFYVELKVHRPFEVEDSEIEQYLKDCLFNFILAKQEDFNK